MVAQFIKRRAGFPLQTVDELIAGRKRAKRPSDKFRSG